MVKHPVILRGLNLAGEDNKPTILRRTDQNFIPAMLAELSQASGLQTVTPQAMNQTGSLKLFQPVHRTFHLVLFEAVCDDFGEPRLDPKQIKGAGLVVRRRVQQTIDGQTTTVMQGWMSAENQVSGWLSFNGNLDDDPDPANRPAAIQSGNKEIDRRLAQLTPYSAPLAESVTPLFVAPPAVCEALGKTILYGLLPTTSAEFSKTPPAETADSNFFKDLLKNTLNPYWQENTLLYLNMNGKRPAGNGHTKFSKIAQLLISLGMYNNQTPTAVQNAAKAVTNAFNKIKLDGPDDKQYKLGTVLANTASDVLNGVTERLTVAGNNFSYKITPAQAQAVYQALQKLTGARAGNITPGENRYDGRNQQFQARGFVRVDRNDGCPPQLIWSEPSQTYTIANWYENAYNNVPPPQVALPDPFDKNAMKNLKPDVSFLVPENLFNFLQSNNMEDLFDGGEPSSGAGVALDWICSFNIPFITICAFIVLSIFLSLLNIVFQWLMFIKICIPIPIPKTD